MKSAYRACVAILSFTLAFATVGAMQAEDEEGFTSIFNGENLDGWKGNSNLWSVKEGAITGQTTTEKPIDTNTFLIWEGGSPANFELRFSYKIVGGNSGLQYRSEVIDDVRFIVGGYQADIDSTPTYSGICYEERKRGILAERGQVARIKADGNKDVVGSLGDTAALQGKIKNEDWNDYIVIARGNHLQHFINGVKMSEVYDEQSDAAASAGILALQLHAGPPMTVQFKNLRIKELK